MTMEPLARLEAPADANSRAAVYELWPPVPPSLAASVTASVRCGQDAEPKKFDVAWIKEPETANPVILFGKPLGLAGVEDVCRLLRQYQSGAGEISEVG